MKEKKASSVVCKGLHVKIFKTKKIEVWKRSDKQKYPEKTVHEK